MQLNVAASRIQAIVRGRRVTRLEEEAARKEAEAEAARIAALPPWEEMAEQRLAKRRLRIADSAPEVFQDEVQSVGVEFGEVLRGAGLKLSFGKGHLEAEAASARRGFVAVDPAVVVDFEQPGRLGIVWFHAQDESGNDVAILEEFAEGSQAEAKSELKKDFRHPLQAIRDGWNPH